MKKAKLIIIINLPKRRKLTANVCLYLVLPGNAAGHCAMCIHLRISIYNKYILCTIFLCVEFPTVNNFHWNYQEFVTFLFCRTKKIEKKIRCKKLFLKLGDKKIGFSFYFSLINLERNFKMKCEKSNNTHQNGLSSLQMKIFIFRFAMIQKNV